MFYANGINISHSTVQYIHSYQSVLQWSLRSNFHNRDTIESISLESRLSEKYIFRLCETQEENYSHNGRMYRLHIVSWSLNQRFSTCCNHCPPCSPTTVVWNASIKPASSVVIHKQKIRPMILRCQTLCECKDIIDVTTTLYNTWACNVLQTQKCCHN